MAQGLFSQVKSHYARKLQMKNMINYNISLPIFEKN